MEDEKFRNTFRISSLRLKEWDYSEEGWYFVTICVKNHACVFGKIKNGICELNEIGRMVQKFWEATPNHFVSTELDEFIIMPNHLHGIIVINKKVETQHCCVSTRKSNTFYYLKPASLSVIIRSFKSICTREINKKFPDLHFQWQSRFYEHIIRSTESLEKIQKYIHFNAEKWEDDTENPKYFL